MINACTARPTLSLVLCMITNDAPHFPPPYFEGTMESLIMEDYFADLLLDAVIRKADSLVISQADVRRPPML